MVDSNMLGTQPNARGSAGSQGSNETPEQKYRRQWSFWGYSLHCALTIFAACVGAALFCWEPIPSLLDINTQHGMQLGFLGAYVYCLNLVYRRYTTEDLKPHVYLSCTVSLIVGMAVNYAAFAVITSTASSTLPSGAESFKGVGAGMAAIVAFSLGYFPYLAIRWFGRVSRTALNERQRRSDALPLLLIDGISELHESRLQDEGIDNVQNLAATDIPDLVAKTPFSARQIVEWVDQALLYLYMDPSEIDKFRGIGVRSVTDLHDILDNCAVPSNVLRDGTAKSETQDENDKVNKRRESVSKILTTTVERLECLLYLTRIAMAHSERSGI